MKAGKIDLSKARFSLEEVIAILGDSIDIQSKFEEAHKHDGDWCLGVTIDDDDSDEIVGEKMAHFANFVASCTNNDLIREQTKRLVNCASEKEGVIEWQ